jgi:hypothetical protein
MWRPLQDGQTPRPLQENATRLPKMRRAGRTDVSDLKVSVNALTPVSAPLCAVG